MKQLPIFEPSIVSKYDGGLYSISLVEFPAIEEHFVTMSAQSERYNVQLSAIGDKSKRLVCGALLIPDQLIYRCDEYLGEYYLKYSASIIERLAENFMRDGWNLTNTTHEHTVSLYDNVVRELWIVQDSKNDKSNALLGVEYPVGTLMCVMKINDTDYYNEQILTGKVKGFSIEAYFRYQLAENQTVTQNKIEMEKNTKTFAERLTAMLFGAKQSTAEDVSALATPAGADATDSATAILLFTLADGTELQVDAEGNATIAGEVAPAGQHTLQDGGVIEVDAEGKFVLTAPDATTTDPAVAQLTAQQKQEAKQRAQQLMQSRQKAPAVKKVVAPSEAVQTAQQATPVTKLDYITAGIKAKQALQTRKK